jgi:hypothetical protein
MNAKMIGAIRKEAFVQGFMRAHARSCGLKLSDFTDEQILSMLPAADEAYATYRAERTTSATDEVAP